MEKMMPDNKHRLLVDEIGIMGPFLAFSDWEPYEENLARRALTILQMNNIEVTEESFERQKNYLRNQDESKERIQDSKQG